MIEMATGVGEDSAIRQETLIGQQCLPCFLNALRQLLVSGSALLIMLLWLALSEIWSD